MKHLNKLLSIMVLVISMGFLSSTQGKAQTTVVLWAYDSTYTTCPTPVTATNYSYGQTTGYNYLTDSIDYHVYFGDGTDSLSTLPLYDAGTYQYFYSNMINHIYTLPGTYTVTSIATGPDGNADTSAYVLTVSNACGNLTGQLYVDNNSNCIFDAGDDTLKYHAVDIYDASSTYLTSYYTNALGQYFFTVPSGVNYTLSVSPFSTSGLTTTCPASGSYSFTSTTGTTVYDFGLACTPGFDLTANGYAWGFVPGQPGWIWPWANNFHCTPVNGTLTLTLDPLVTFVSSTWGPAPTSVVGSTITWDFIGLGSDYSAWWWYGFWSEIEILTSSSATIGDSVCFTVSVTPTTGDLDPTNNTYTFCKAVQSSYDPNMKEVSPKGIGSTGEVAPETELTYTVHFQNTGTYMAFDINVVDTIDANLDMSTFQILGSSHPMVPILSNTNIMKFEFNDINLPDSASNEPLSHGWIKYKAKAKAGLSNGTPIENTAHIFFDFNSAIVTNTTLNTINTLLSVTNKNIENNVGLQVYPNPSNSVINIQVDGEVNRNILIIDATGKLVLSSQLNGNSTTLNIEQLPSGIYQVVIPGATTLTSRFQKIK